MKIKYYAIYKGDKFIDLGTKEYLANKLGVKPYTIYFYTTPVYKRRIKNTNYNNRIIVIEI